MDDDIAREIATTAVSAPLADHVFSAPTLRAQEAGNVANALHNNNMHNVEVHVRAYMPETIIQ
jgi:hypothetical protein